MDTKRQVAVTLGLVIVLGSHLYTLAVTKPLMTMKQHCYINIMAAVLILIALL